MKKRSVFLIICCIVIADQVLKIYIKTHYHAGESHAVIGNWFQLYFIENEGMAYGWQFGGEWGKMALTLFRLAAVIFGVFYLKKIIEKKYQKGFIICVSLIFAGALGNLIDSMFYGLIFEKSSLETYNIAKMFPAHGYAGFLHGNVVDMLYFPIIHTQLPSWLPIWGGNNFDFFSPIFNLADASISTGIIAIFVFQKRFFKSNTSKTNQQSIETKALVNDEIGVS
ncbi:MAG TPA: lipoprotein signal peptidase [Hanamia sp.]|nr:lipoprotein signal peptidase [Hanamia sp.]